MAIPARRIRTVSQGIFIGNSALVPLFKQIEYVLSDFMFESGKRITMQIHTGKQLQWKKAGIQVWVEPVVDAIYRERVYARATAAR